MQNRTWGFMKQIAVSLRRPIIPPSCLSSHLLVNHPSPNWRRWHHRKSRLMKQERGNHESGAHVYVARQRVMIDCPAATGRMGHWDAGSEWTPRNLSVEVVFLDVISLNGPQMPLWILWELGDVDAHMAAGVGWWQGGHVWRTLVPGHERVSHWCQCVCQGLSYLVASMYTVCACMW